MFGKLPHITTAIDDFVPYSNLHDVKTWIKTSKHDLPEYARECINRVEDDSNFRFHQVFTIGATYYSACDMPVLCVVGMVFRKDISDIDRAIEFVEVFTSNDNTPPIIHRWVHE